MCAESACLALRLSGPMQSWGFSSQYNRRNTGLMPSKSAVAGLCCAALGAGRGTEAEAQALEAIRQMPMLAVSLKKGAARRLQDYHTVLGAVSADGKRKFDAVLTYRQYVQDGDYLVLLKGEREVLERLAGALQNPVWGLWMGRKACIPSRPVFGGLFVSEEEALKAHACEPLEQFPHERETDAFAEGDDSRADQPYGFCSADRRFGLRRVRRAAGQRERI